MDRHEDITHPNVIAEDPKCDRSVTFYGYVRGSHLKPGTKMHMIGAGDFTMAELSMIPDPCPLPNQEKKSQSLNKKDSLLYAPLSNVGAVSFDKDAVYIDIGRVNYTKKENLVPNVKDDDDDANHSESDDDDAPASLLKSLQDVTSGVDEKMKKSSLRIFKSSERVPAEESESDSDSDSNDSQPPKRMSRSAIEELAKPFRRAMEKDESTNTDDSDEESIDDESESDQPNASDESSCNEAMSDDDVGSDEESSDTDESEPEVDTSDKPTSALWKENLAQRAAEAYLVRESSLINLQELIYGRAKSVVVSDDDSDKQGHDDGNDSGSDDDFFKLRKPDSEKNADAKSNSGTKSDAQLLDENDSSKKLRGNLSNVNVSDWFEVGEESLIESIRNKFVTGSWDNSGANLDDGKEKEEFGDFEDLETGEKFGPNGETDSDDESSINQTKTDGMTDEKIRELNAKKKANKKNNFDEEYDEEKMIKGVSATSNDENAEDDFIESLKKAKEARFQRHRDEFGNDGEATRLRHEGFRQGLYVRIRMDGVPCEFVENFKPEFPLVLGGLTPQETNRGFIRCRFKKHRWHKKILKCNDPLIFSVGWRRFQSIPVFSTEDQNGRHRYVDSFFLHVSNE